MSDHAMASVTQASGDKLPTCRHMGVGFEVERLRAVHGAVARSSGTQELGWVWVKIRPPGDRRF